MEGNSPSFQREDVMLSGQTHDSAAQFQPGMVVEVMPRLWPGMNKQGGAARITKVHYDHEEECYMYDVTYIVNHGKETGVADCFIKPAATESGRRRMQGRCKFCGSFIRDCQHDQDGPNPLLARKNRASNENAIEDDLFALLASFQDIEAMNQSNSSMMKSLSEPAKKQNSSSPRKKSDKGTKNETKKRKLDGTIKKDREKIVSQVFHYDDTILNDHIPIEEEMVPSDNSIVPANAVEIKTSANTVEVRDLAAPSHPDVTILATSSHFAPKVDNNAIENPKDEARALHRSIFTNCLELEDQGDTDRAFIVNNENIQDIGYMKSDFKQLINEISKLSQNVSYELLRLGYNFIINIISKFKNITKTREDITATCRRKEEEATDRLGGQLDDFAVTLAQRIVDLDDEQERIFRQIERAGFDVFDKAEHRVKVTMKENPNKAMKKQISVLSLKINEIKMTWSSTLKDSRSEMESIADWFSDFYGYSVEDVVDGNISDSDSSESASSLSESEESTDEELSRDIDLNQWKPSKIRDASDGAATIRRKTSHTTADLSVPKFMRKDLRTIDGLTVDQSVQQHPHSSGAEINRIIASDNDVTSINDVSWDGKAAKEKAVITTSGESIGLLSNNKTHGNSGAHKQHVDAMVTHSKRNSSSRRKADDEFADFIDSEDDMAVIYSNKPKRRQTQERKNPYQNFEISNNWSDTHSVVVSKSSTHQPFPTSSSDSKNQIDVIDLSGKNDAEPSHVDTKRQGISYPTKKVRQYDQFASFEGNSTKQYYEQGKFYRHISPTIINPDARFDGRVVLIEGDKLMDNMFNVPIPSKSKKSVESRKPVNAIELSDSNGESTEDDYDVLDDDSSLPSRWHHILQNRTITSTLDVNLFGKHCATLLSKTWYSIEKVWNRPLNNNFGFNATSDKVFEIFDEYWEMAVSSLQTNSTDFGGVEHIIKEFAEIFIRDVNLHFQEMMQLLNEIQQYLGQRKFRDFSERQKNLQDCWRLFELQAVNNLKLLHLVSCEEFKMWLKVKLRLRDQSGLSSSSSSSSSPSNERNFGGTTFSTYHTFVSLVLRVFSQVEKLFFDVNGVVGINGMVELITCNCENDQYMDKLKVIYASILMVKQQWILRQLAVVCNKSEHGETQQTIDDRCMILVDQLLVPLVGTYSAIITSMIISHSYMKSVIAECCQFVRIVNSPIFNKLLMDLEETELLQISFVEWMKLNSSPIMCLTILRSLSSMEYISKKIVAYFGATLSQVLTQVSQPATETQKKVSSKYQSLRYVVEKKTWDRVTSFFNNLTSFASAQVVPSDKILSAFINYPSSGICSIRAQSISVSRITLGDGMEVTHGSPWQLVGFRSPISMQYDLETMWSMIIMTTKLLSAASVFEKSSSSRVPNNWNTVKGIALFITEKMNTSAVSKIQNGNVDIFFRNSEWISSQDAFNFINELHRHFQRLATMALQWDCTFEGFETIISGYQSLSPFVHALRYTSLDHNMNDTNDIKDHDDGDDIIEESAFERQNYPEMNMLSFVTSVFNCHQVMRSASLSTYTMESSSSFLVTCSILLHQHLFAIVSMVFQSLGIINPLMSDGHESKLLLNQHISQFDSINFLSHLRSYLHSFLSLAILDEVPSPDQTTKSKQVFNINQYRRLKTQIGNLACRKKLLDIFRSHPSFSTGVLLCMITKELSTLFTTKVVQEEWKMCKDLMDLFIDTNLMPPLINASKEEVSIETPTVVDSDKERSCLMMLLTLWTFNPFPVKIQLATGQQNANNNCIIPLMITNQEFIKLTKQLWKDEDEQLLSLSPFLRVVELINTIHENTLKEFRVVTPMVESLLYAAFSSLTALLSHWIISTKDIKSSISNKRTFALSLLKLHRFPRELLKSLLMLVKIQSHSLKRSSTIIVGTTKGIGNGNVKINLEIGAILSYCINMVSEYLQQYMIETIMPTIYFMRENDERPYNGQNAFQATTDIQQNMNEERKELHQFLATYLHQHLESFDEICQETICFASDLRIALGTCLNRCHPINEDFSFSFTDSSVQFDFSPPGIHQQITSRDKLKFITCQNLCHIILRALSNIHQVLMWRGTIITRVGTNPQHYYSNPQEFFQLFYKILQILIEKDPRNAGFYVLEHWLWQLYFDRWYQLVGENDGTGKIIFQSDDMNILLILETFINNSFNQIFMADLISRMVFKSKSKLFTAFESISSFLTVDGETIDTHGKKTVSPSALSKMMENQNKVMVAYYQTMSSQLPNAVPLSMTFHQLLLNSWCNELHLTFDLHGVESPLISLYRNGLQFVASTSSNIAYYQSNISPQSMFTAYLEKIHKQILHVIFFLRLCSFQDSGSNKPLIDQQIQHLMKMFTQFSTFIANNGTSTGNVLPGSSYSSLSLISIENTNKYFRDYLSIPTRQLCESLHNLLNKSTIMDHYQNIRYASRRRVDLNQYLMNLVLHVRLACMTPFATRCLEWDVILYPLLVVALHEAAWSAMLPEHNHQSGNNNTFSSKKQISRESVEHMMELLNEMMIQFILAAIFPSFTAESDQWETILNTIIVNSFDSQRITPSPHFISYTLDINTASEMWKRCMTRNALAAKEALHRWNKMQVEELVSHENVRTFSYWSTPYQSSFLQHLVEPNVSSQLSPPWKKAIVALETQKLIPSNVDATKVAMELSKRMHAYYVLIDDSIAMYSMSWDD